MTFPVRYEVSSDVVDNVHELLIQTRLLDCLGDFDDYKAHNGYTKAVAWNDGKVQVSFSPERPDNRIFLYFSATGLRYFLGNFDNDYDAIDFITDAYNLGGKLTRIDIAVDGWNIGSSVDELAHHMENGKVTILNLKKQKPFFKSIRNNWTTNSLYFGSEKSDKILRIYNKKVEQERNDSPFMIVALSSSDWSRLEGEFKKATADSIGNLLTKHCDDDHTALLTQVIKNSWIFNGKWPLFDFIASYNSVNSDQWSIVPTIPVQTSIANMIHYYLVGGSAGTLYKIKRLFGESGLELFQNKVKDYVNHPNSPYGYRVSHNAKRDLERLKLEVNGNSVDKFWDDAISQEFHLNKKAISAEQSKTDDLENQ